MLNAIFSSCGQQSTVLIVVAQRDKGYAKPFCGEEGQFLDTEHNVSYTKERKHLVMESRTQTLITNTFKVQTSVLTQ